MKCATCEFNSYSHVFGCYVQKINSTKFILNTTLSFYLTLHHFSRSRCPFYFLFTLTSVNKQVKKPGKVLWRYIIINKNNRNRSEGHPPRFWKDCCTRTRDALHKTSNHDGGSEWLVEESLKVLVVPEPKAAVCHCRQGCKMNDCSS